MIRSDKPRPGSRVSLLASPWLSRRRRRSIAGCPATSTTAWGTSPKRCPWRAYPWAARVTLTTEQINLIVDLLPIPLERELLEEDLSVTDRNEVRREMDEVEKIIDVLVSAQEAGR